MCRHFVKNSSVQTEAIFNSERFNQVKINQVKTFANPSPLAPPGRGAGGEGR